ncbi:MAG: zinc-ribbon domain-containing protein [Promethearchaeota archaeon]|jgi:hypothetical protein
MSPYCSNCGAEIEDSWNICPTCGKSLRETQTIPQPQPQQAPQPYPAQPQQKSKPIGGGNIYGIVSLICGLVGLLGIFAFFGIFLGVLAIILGGLGISNDDNNAFAIVGIILGILDFTCCIIFYFFIFSFLSWLPFMMW